MRPVPFYATWLIAGFVVIAVILCALATVLPSLLVVHADNDPIPRFELLGREVLESRNIAGEPAKVFVYRDNALNNYHQLSNEIICFSGHVRETLSCYPSGRRR